MPPGYDQIGMGGSALTADTSLIELSVYAVLILIGVIFFFLVLAVFSLPIFFVSILILEFVLRLLQSSPDPIGKYAKIAGLVFRNLRRNLVRTSLSYIALFILTGMLTLIYSIVWFLALVTQEREDNLQVIMTEKYSIPSLMPRAYANQLRSIIMEDLDPQYRPNNIDDNFMTWSFVGGTLDINNRTPENSLFFFALNPDSVLTMMNDQGLNKEDLGEKGYQELVNAIDLVKQDKRNIIVGQDRLDMLGVQVGDKITFYSVNYPDIVFDMNIVATFPSESRYGKSAAMQADYLFDKIDEAVRPGGIGFSNKSAYDKHINLIWVRLQNRQAYEQLAAIVNNPRTFASPAVKLETASAGLSSFLDSFKDILWGMKYIIMPAIMVIMCLVVGITITIGVRERWTEMAVMKVLGFQPSQVMSMIVSESVLIGLFGGMLSTWSVYFLPLFMRSSGIEFKVAFFTNFKAPWEIVIYGPILGIAVGLIGALVPALSAKNVKVSEVFARVA